MLALFACLAFVITRIHASNMNIRYQIWITRKTDEYTKLSLNFKRHTMFPQKNHKIHSQIVDFSSNARRPTSRFLPLSSASPYSSQTAEINVNQTTNHNQFSILLFSLQIATGVHNAQCQPKCSHMGNAMTDDYPVRIIVTPDCSKRRQ